MQSTLSKQAYDQLRARLCRGELPPGTRLVNRTLAKDLGVSFTPVREAINRLASEGLVEYVRGAGAYVRQVGPRELAELYEVRETLEPQAAASAARQISDHELEELQAICDDWHRIVEAIRDNGQPHATPEQMAVWTGGEVAFHAMLVVASRNRWLIRIVDQMQVVAQTFHPQRNMSEFLTLHNASITWRSHMELVRALRRRDADAARDWMTEHIRTGRRCVLEHLRRSNWNQPTDKSPS